MTEPEIIFEDNDILVLDKPAGWVVNRVESSSAPLIQDWISHYLPKFSLPAAASDGTSDFLSRNGLVHRLDKETSGLLLTAKNEPAFTGLLSQFATRQVKKKYQALVHGSVESDGEVKAPVGRLPWNRERFGVFPEGKQATTAYYVQRRYRFSPGLYERLVKESKNKNLAENEAFSLLRLQPTTGRTHQIRVHLKSLGHPIVSDTFYAGRKTSRLDRFWCPRLFLHADYLGFSHPVSGQWLEFTLDLPEDLERALGFLAVD